MHLSCKIHTHLQFVSRFPGWFVPKTIQQSSGGLIESYWCVSLRIFQDFFFNRLCFIYLEKQSTHRNKWRTYLLSVKSSMKRI